MTIYSKIRVKATPKPIARLDASLLVARKGEAAPSVAATQQNNPGLAWGAPAHPHDFKPETYQQPVAQPSAQLAAKARLRPDSFFRGATSAHANTRATRITQDRDPVALTLRVEDETYLRLKYLAQRTGRSTQEVLTEALSEHLVQSGVPKSRKLMVTPE